MQQTMDPGRSLSFSPHHSAWTDEGGLNGSSSSGTWQRSVSQGDVVNMLRSPKNRRRPFDSRSHPEELLSAKDATVFSLTAPLNPDPGNRITKGRYLERQGDDTPFSSIAAFSASASPVPRVVDPTPMSMVSMGNGGQSMNHSMGGSPKRGMISPQSTRGNRSMRSSTRANDAPKGEDRALDFWPLGEGMRIANHIAPTKSRSIALTGEIYQGKPRSDWNDAKHVHAIRSQYPTGKLTMQASCGPFPQGMSPDELRRNRQFDRSHGSMRCDGGMMRVGSQVMFL